MGETAPVTGDDRSVGWAAEDRRCVLQGGGCTGRADLDV